MAEQKCSYDGAYVFDIKGGMILCELILKCYEAMWEWYLICESPCFVCYTWVIYVHCVHFPT